MWKGREGKGWRLFPDSHSDTLQEERSVGRTGEESGFCEGHIGWRDLEQPVEPTCEAWDAGFESLRRQVSQQEIGI